MSDSVIYANRPSLYTLKGLIAVQLLDGEEIEGEFATQDAYNIFVLVDGEPLMIPRLQIRWIRGLQGQPIEADTSQAAAPDPLSTQPLPFAVDTGPSTEVSMPVAVPVTPPVPESAEEEEGTVILPSKTERPPVVEEELEDEDDGTLILVAEEVEIDDEEAGTMMLPIDQGILSAAPVLPVDVDEEIDMTMVLGRDLEIPGNLIDDDVFSVLASPAPKKTQATLTCTGGPHAGDVFILETGISTIGRSADNLVVLSKDKEISRRHSIIIFESGRYVVQDQNSLNGTFVNDEQISSPRFLEPGDVVLVGVSPMRFELS